MSNKGKHADYQDNFNGSSSREIYSHSKGKKTHRIQLGAKTLRNRKIILSFAIALSVFVGLLGAAFIYAYNILDSLNYNPLTTDFSGDDSAIITMTRRGWFFLWVPW